MVLTTKHREKRYPLSHYQKQFYFEWASSPQSTRYNIPIVFRLKGPLDISALKSALNKYVNWYNPLSKGRFYKEQKGIFYVIPECCDVSLNVTHIKRKGQKKREKTIKRVIREKTGHIFDLHTGPLFTFDLYVIGDKDHLFILNYHHVVFDGGSVDSLFRELSTLYNCHISGSSALTPFHIPWKKYIEYDQKNGGDAKSIETVRYWENYLLGKKLYTHLPFENSAMLSDGSKTKQIRSFLDQNRVDKIQDLSIRLKATPFVILTAIYAGLIARYTHEESVTLAYPVDARPKAFKGLNGCFVNTLPLVISFTANATFLDIIRQIKRDRSETRKHQHFPTMDIIEIYRRMGGLSEKNMLNIECAATHIGHPGFSFREILCEGGIFGECLFADDINMDISSDLSLMFNVSYSPMPLCLQYNEQKFDESVMKTFMQNFMVMCDAFITDPQTDIFRTPFVLHSEKEALTEPWGRGEIIENPEKMNIPSMFDSISACFPDHIALGDDKSRLCFDQLNRYTNQLARYICHRYKKCYMKEMPPETRIGVFMHRGIDLIISLLAILKSGGAYVPIDTRCPDPFIEYVVKDSETRLILTKESHLTCLNGCTLFKKEQLIDYDGERASIAKYSDLPFNLTKDASQLAYIVYTSGTTGHSKGVMVEHRGLVTLSKWYQSFFNLSPKDRSCQFAAASFDTFGCEVWPFLLNGASVWVVGEKIKYDPDKLIHWYRENEITYSDLPSSYARILFQRPIPHDLSLKCIKVGGEAMGRRLFTSLPFDIVNSYGITEASIESTFSRIYTANEPLERNDQFRIPPIGRPIFNTSIHILDDHGNPVPIGVPGEIYIEGDGIARGYTVEHHGDFVSPFKEKEGGRTYKAGDWGRWLPDGEIEYLWRKDFQIKRNGVRIELSGIEKEIQSLNSVNECVLVHQKNERMDRLIAYVTPQKGQRLGASLLKGLLMKRLPTHMMPDVIWVMDALPLNQNGKVDRNRLLKKGLIIDKDEDDVPPQTPLQLKIAHIWRSILDDPDLKPLSIFDDFFKIGGSSLRLMQMMIRFNTAFAAQFSPIDFFRHTTIHSQEKLINTKNGAYHKKIIFFTRPNSDPPLIFIPPRGAGAEVYYEFSKFFAGRKVFCAVESYNLFTDERRYISALKPLARMYVNRLKRQIPKGPYYLGGWSFGGNVAYEMAIQLREKGDQVPMVFMLDSILLDESEKAVATSLEPYLEKYFSQMKDFKALHPDIQKKLIAVRRLENEMFLNYQHPTSDLNVSLYKSTVQTLPEIFTPVEKNEILKLYGALFQKPYNGWEKLTPFVRRVMVEGAHKDMVYPPVSDKIAASMCLLIKRESFRFPKK